jgi:cytochrome P450
MFVLEWLDVFVAGGNGPTHVTEEVNEAFINFGALHMMMVDERRIEPKDDLLSLWINAEIDGVKLDEDQLLFEHTMMMIGGSETARNAMTGAVHAMATHPKQRELLRDNPSLSANAAEEAIRYVTPFVRMSRTATRNTELLGQPIYKGDEIIMLYPPANRDPRKFDNADQFDVQREFKAKSVSFGYGRHFCLGAMLARAEVRIALEQLMARMPDFELAGEPVYTVSSFIRGIRSLPIKFTPGSRR